MTDDWLSNMYRNQAKLQELLGYDFWAMDGDARAEYVRLNVLACENELHEALNETRWKPWTFGQSGIVDEERFGGELVDALHFLLNLFLVAGWTPERIHAGFMDKQAVNRRRQEEKYDGQSTKCAYRKCRRALDDPTTAAGVVLTQGLMWCNDGCYDGWYDDRAREEGQKST